MRIILIGFLAATMLSSTAMAKNGGDADKLGKGDYQLHVFPGLNMNQAARMTTIDFDLVKMYDTACRDSTKRQNPSMLKTVFLYSLRTAPFAFLGGMGGAKAGGFIYKGGPSVVGYGAYNGIASLGAAIGGGINAHEMGKHASVGGCMMGMVNEAKRLGALRHIIIAYNAFPVNGHAIRRSSLPAPTDAEMQRAGQFGTQPSMPVETPESASETTAPPPQ